MSNLNFDASPNLTHYSQAQIPLALIRLYYVAGLKFNPKPKQKGMLEKARESKNPRKQDAKSEYSDFFAWFIKVDAV